MGKRKADKLTASNTDTSYQTTLENIILTVLLIVLFIPALIGIYTRHDFFIMHLITAIPILIVVFLYNKDRLNIFGTYLDYFLFGLTLLFLISILWAVWPHKAIEEAFKYVNYFLIYWFVAKLVKREQISIFIKILFTLGTFMSVLGLFDYLQIVDINAAVRGGRITGTLHYTNAFAAYVATTYILGLYLSTLKGRFTWVYSMGSFVMLVAFMGTLSRAMWLLFLPLFVLYIIGFKGNKRDNTLNAVFISILGVCAAFIVFSEASVAAKIIALILGALLSTLSAKMLSYLEELRIKPSHLFFGSAVSVVALGFVIFQYILSDKILERILQINLQESSVVARFTYYHDAWRIIMENPIFGYGGGAWEALYQLYRSYLYHTTEMHCHIMEIGIATGIPGMFLFLAAIIYIVIVLLKTKEPAVWSLSLATLIILSHSMLDFDLSIGFLSLVTWAMMGAIANSASGRILKEIRIKKLLIIVFILLYIAGSAVLLVSDKYSNLGEKENFADAYNRMNKALTLYPFHAKNHATLANINFLAYQETENKKYLDEALLAINKAIKLDKLNYNWYTYKAQYLIEKGELEEALSLLKQKRDYLFKYDNEAYAKTAHLMVSIAQKYSEQGDTASDKTVFKEVLQLWEEAKEEMAAVTPNLLEMWVEEETLTDYDPFLLEVIRAYDYLGDNRKAQELLQELSPETIKENEWLKNL